MIACISIPYFAAAVERRSDDSLAEKPLAIGGQPWEAKPVYAFSREVAHMGVKSGMSLRLVQVLSPQSHFMPAASEQYSQVSGEVMDVLTDFSCLIEPQELWHSAADSKQYFSRSGRTLPAHYCLDLESLPMRESLPFAQELGKTLRQETRLAPAIGLAANKFTAQVAATLCRPSHALPVEPGADAQFLASRPVDFLPLDNETARRLRMLGIRELGQLAELPSTAVHTQFGPEMMPLYRLARGQIEEPVDAVPMNRYEEAGRQFDEPVADMQVLAVVSHQLAGELAQRLQAGSWEGRELHLRLEMEAGDSQHHMVTFRQLTANIQRLTGALDDLYSQIAFSSGVVGLSVAVAGLEPAAVQQLTLFGETSVSRYVHQTIQNLAAKYKTSRFYGPVLTERNHPLPERRFQLQGLAQAVG